MKRHLNVLGCLQGAGILPFADELLPFAERAAHEALTAGLTPDVVLTEAEGALDALGELTGRTAREEMVTRIFERFCVGK